jgi:NAD-dependent deacetylase
MKKLAVLTGAGISAESGLSTFRGEGGLWAGHDVTEVASPEGWARDQSLVLEFYNQRRKAANAAQPNQAHFLLAELGKFFEVTIITQNVDDLHERAGSKSIIHLHGELSKSRSTKDPQLVYSISGDELNIGDCCEKGSQLRPHIVWFGEMVPLLEDAALIVSQADVLAIIGTSLLVYPAASLIHYARPGIPIYIIDPNMPLVEDRDNLFKIPKPATIGTAILYVELTKADVQ